MKLYEGAPVFAVEVRGEGDYGPAAEQARGEKRRDYFAAETLVVWDVDLLGNVIVRVYRASDPDHPTLYRRGDVADAEPAVPGWRMPVDDLFPPPSWQVECKRLLGRRIPFTRRSCERDF